MKGMPPSVVFETEVYATEQVGQPVMSETFPVFVYLSTEVDSIKWKSSSKGEMSIIEMGDSHLANTIRYAERVYHERVATRMEEMEEGIIPNTPEHVEQLDLMLMVGPEWYYPMVYRFLVREGRARGLDLPECHWYESLKLRALDKPKTAG